MALSMAQRVARLATDTDVVHSVVHGATGATVSTEGGLIRSLAGTMQTLAAYTPRGAWSTGSAYALKDLATQGGLAYVCTVAHTAGTFSTDLAAGKWTIHRGASAEDLADDADALKGAALIGYRGRSVRDRLDDVVSVLDYGAKGDGVTDDTDSILAGANAATSLGARLVIPHGAYRISQAATLSGSVVFAGGLISVDSGVTLTITGHISAPPVQIFSGAGVVRPGVTGTSGNMRVDRVYPQWWGAKGDGTTDDTSAIKASVAFMTYCGGELHFPQGVYKLTDSLSINTNQPIKMTGVGSPGYRQSHQALASVLLFAVSNGTDGVVLTDTTQFSYSNLIIRRATQESAGGGGRGLAILSSYSNRFERFSIAGFDYGVVLDSSSSSLQPALNSFRDGEVIDSSTINIDVRAAAGATFTSVSAGGSTSTTQYQVRLGVPGRSYGADSVRFYSCSFIQGVGTAPNHVGVMFVFGIDCELNGCVLEQGKWGVAFNLPADLYQYRDMRHLAVVNCWLNGHTDAVVVFQTRANALFSGNRFGGYNAETALVWAVSSEAGTKMSSIIFANNMFLMRVCDVGIFVSGIRGAIINGNHFDSEGDGKTKPAVTLTASADRCIVTGNHIACNYGTNGVQDNGTNNVVANNTFGNVEA